MSPKWIRPWVEAGRPGYVNVQALPDRIVEGKVTRTSWVLGANRTLRTEFDLPNPERPAAAGNVCHRATSFSKSAPTFTCSRLGDRPRRQASILLGRQGWPGGAIPITLGLQVGSDVEVTSGLKEDESGRPIAAWIA